MKLALFTDIHGNKEALSSIIDDIKKQNIDEIICLGDVLGIGPNPKECMDIIIENNIEMVLGNHELYFVKGPEIDDEITGSQLEHHKWIRGQITEAQKAYLEKCNMYIEKTYNNKKVLFEHFLIDNKSKDEYPFYSFDIIKDESIKTIVDSLDYDLIFVGHEHKNFIVNNKMYDIGSSGCRKDNTTRYTIFDTETFKIETKIIDYDREKFKQELLKNNYPDRELVSKWFFGIEV